MKEFTEDEKIIARENDSMEKEESYECETDKKNLQHCLMNYREM